jgi:L-sorbose 1-phosphate reductase
MNPIEQYRSGTGPIPGSYLQWRLRGAGLENLSLERTTMPSVGDDELLVRHDACGICFSDVKIVNLGPDHPRLAGRDMARNPVVMGHEVALTVMNVGAGLTAEYEVGQRFIVQADVYYGGANLAYGYVLDGGMSQYNVIGKEVLRGDEGAYLLPLAESTGYVEAALVEPWACVVAAYKYAYRSEPLTGGSLLAIGCGMAVDRRQLEDYARSASGSPAFVRVLVSEDGRPLEEVLRLGAGGRRFDDIVMIGSPSESDVAAAAAHLGKHGVLNLAVDRMPDGPVTLDIGRIHYDQQLFVGGRLAIGLRDAALNYASNVRSDLRGGGCAWMIGAGGPMGQMHVQRAIMSGSPPKRIVVTDTNAERISRLLERFQSAASDRGVELTAIDSSQMSRSDHDARLGAMGPFDDIVSMVPSPSLVSESLPFLADGGVYNIFAGVAKGVTAEIDLRSVLRKNQRIVGTSGSSIADLAATLSLVESRALSTDSSLGAIGGLSAFSDGLAAVKSGVLAGKVVIFPHIADLPLTPLEEMKTRLPSVYERLSGGGRFWSKDAEQELFGLFLGE